MKPFRNRNEDDFSHRTFDQWGFMYFANEERIYVLHGYVGAF